MMKPFHICLFGGTFDPIHVGHLALAQAAVEQAGVDEIRFLPCHTSPHKQGVLTAPPAERLEMVRLATADLPWATVDSHDLDAPQPAYSIRTAEDMQSCFPEAKLSWLLGVDQWNALPRWHQVERLAGIVDFIVGCRDGESPVPREGFSMRMLSFNHPASATAIRASAASGRLLRDWLPAPVADFIEKQGLYR